jgi:hypothetical protein
MLLRSVQVCFLLVGTTLYAAFGSKPEIVPSIVESGDSRRTARYATWTC